MGYQKRNVSDSTSVAIHFPFRLNGLLAFIFFDEQYFTSMIADFDLVYDFNIGNFEMSL